MNDAVAREWDRGMDEQQARKLRARNIRTGLILAAIALGFAVVWAMRRL
ncbi:MAG TPA: hypothetical protein VHB46_13930 [Burkholderiales bacterium]|nr:hypothetical protein [Burkholderiales bacterium]